MHLPIYFSLKTAMFIVMTETPFLLEIADLVISAIIVSSQTALLRWLTFLLGSWLWLSEPCSFGLFLLILAFCPTAPFPLLKNYNHVAVSVSIDFPSNQNKDSHFICTAYDYFCAHWGGLCYHLIDVSWNIFKLDASAATNQLSGLRLNMMYMAHHKYQNKPRSSMVFSCLCCCHSP